MPSGESKVISKGHCVLAHGEHGHSHVVEDDEAELIQIGERMLLTLVSPATIKHAEHGPIRLSSGIWEVGQVKEFDWFQKMERRVID